ncbi:cytochrome P450, partial [Nocardia ninae]
MTTINHGTDLPGHPGTDTPPPSLPLVPITARSAWAAQLMTIALSGWIDDPGKKSRDAGEITRAAYPVLPKPLRLLFPDPYADGWTGETVFVNSPRIAHEMYNLPPGHLDHEAWKKAHTLLLGSQSPFVLREPDHTRVRRALATELTPPRIETYRQRSVERLDAMIDQLPLDTPVSLHDFYTRFTQDVILRVVFGWDDCRDLDELAEFLYRASRHYATRKIGGLLAYQLNARIKMRPRANRDVADRDDVPLRILYKAYRLRKHADELLYRKIAELRARPNDSIATRLIERGAREDPPWTDKRLRDIIATLTVAGHDTSVLGYAWATQYLLHNPEPRATVTAEARAAITDRYAQACNTEALRMQAPVLAALPSPLRQDIVLGGYRIRKGTLLFLPATALHYNTDLYPEPETYRPERWFETKPERYGFIPFGAGPHRCPGSTFYLTEAAIVTHRVFGRLDLEPRRRRVDPARFIFATVSRPKSGTDVIIRHRRPAAEVPWYRPGHAEGLTPLKQALLPPDPGADEPARCPYP